MAVRESGGQRVRISVRFLRALLVAGLAASVVLRVQLLFPDARTPSLPREALPAEAAGGGWACRTAGR
jgi:hypothetical protein